MKIDQFIQKVLGGTHTHTHTHTHTNSERERERSTWAVSIL